MRRRLLASCLALALLGCEDDTAILVEVSGAGLSAPDDVDVLNFVVTSDVGTRFEQAYPLPSLPQSLTLVPSGDAEREVTVVVEGTRGGVLVVRRVLRTAFQPGQTLRVQVVLTAACLGVMCPEGVDCVDGRCGAVLPDGGVGDAGPPFDAGADAGAPGDDAGPGVDGGTDAGFDGGFDGGTDAGPPGPVPLLFSEYVEGTSNNKAIEIANVGARAVDLSTCTLERYSNGNTSPAAIALGGSLAPGAVHVVCNSSIDVGSARCDAMDGGVSHNGNDAYALRCGGDVIDSFGQVGSADIWTGGGLSTADFVLRRRCGAAADTSSSDAFDPSTQWMGSAYADPTSSHAGLGDRSECP